jgi:hypothetical protein
MGKSTTLERTYPQRSTPRTSPPWLGAKASPTRWRLLTRAAAQPGASAPASVVRAYVMIDTAPTPGVDLAKPTTMPARFVAEMIDKLAARRRRILSGTVYQLLAPRLTCTRRICRRRGQSSSKPHQRPQALAADTAIAGNHATADPRNRRTLAQTAFLGPLTCATQIHKQASGGTRAMAPFRALVPDKTNAFIKSIVEIRLSGP